MRRSGPEYAGALSLIALGAVLGPSGLGVLTPQLLALVDPAVPVGLAALGVLAGLELRGTARSELNGSVVSAALDLAVAAAVAATTALLALGLGVDRDALWAVAAVTGICALAARSGSAALPILLGGLALAWMRSQSPAAIWTVANAVGVAAGCAVAGWLMLRRPSSDNEQRAVALAILLLIGGAADYLSVSALLGGLAAGACWRMMTRATRESVLRDVTYLRHPVLAVLLLTAGAHIQLTAITIGVGIGYAAAAAMLSRLGALIESTRASGSNILAVAFALSAFRVAGPEMAMPFAAVVVGTALSQAVALSLGRRERFE
jgi:hypothetical protein